MLLVISSGLYVIYREKYEPVNSEFSGFGIVVLTLPWSIVLDKLFNIEPGGFVYRELGRFCLYGLINASLLYAFAAALDYLDTSKKKDDR